MSHDLIAELDGYRAELARYAREGRTDRADAVREQADRVISEIRVEAEKADARADNHEEAGQDIAAAKERVEAKRLRRAFAELDKPETATDEDAEPDTETATDKTPRETAVRKRGSHG